MSSPCSQLRVKLSRAENRVPELVFGHRRRFCRRTPPSPASRRRLSACGRCPPPDPARTVQIKSRPRSTKACTGQHSLTKLTVVVFLKNPYVSLFLQSGPSNLKDLFSWVLFLTIGPLSFSVFPLAALSRPFAPQTLSS
jgi:hypothetical protein